MRTIGRNQSCALQFHCHGLLLENVLLPELSYDLGISPEDFPRNLPRIASHGYSPELTWKLESDMPRT
jgi:hypothetical protein